MKYGSSATRTKRYVARCTRYFPKLQVAEFQLEAGELHPGDEVVLIGKTTGTLIFNIEEMRLERDPVPEVVKGQLFAMPVPARVRVGDRLYLWQEN